MLTWVDMCIYKDTWTLGVV